MVSHPHPWARIVAACQGILLTVLCDRNAHLHLCDNAAAVVAAVAVFAVNKDLDGRLLDGDGRGNREGVHYSSQWSW